MASEVSIVSIIVIGSILAVIFASIRILREYERGVVFMLGRFWKVKGPGLILVIPVIQQMVRVDQRVVVMDVPEETQLKRTVARDDNDEAQVRRIMAAQLTRNERLESADIVIDNSGSLDELDGTVAELHKEFLLRAEMSGE